MRHIRRYSNRKLYDTTDKRYVTLPELAKLIQSGAEVEVTDKDTGDDLTGAVLAQVIESLQREAPRMKLASLVALIREYPRVVSGDPPALSPSASPAR
jgi:polyhydroxyalkanoate synthesis repressor PhaR